MRFREPLIKLAVLSVMAAGVAACGPTKVKLDPKSVVNVSVQPASGQPLFCPGDAFQIELLAKLKDGSTCSSTDRKRGCLGEKDAVIDPADVRVSGSSGRITGPPEKFIWTPDSNPLATADTGMTLKGWIEKLVNGTVEKSIEGEAALKPVYDCQSERVFTATRDGGAGPDLIIAVTTLSTPYYPNAALIRVENGPDRMYFISSAADQPVKIISKGGAGAQGAQGSQGQPGADGKSADGSSMCAKGGSGGDGYVYLPGDGDDMIIDLSGAPDVDELVLAGGIEPVDVRIMRLGVDDLLLTFTDGSIRVCGYFASPHAGIERVLFDHAPPWTREDIELRAIDQLHADWPAAGPDWHDSSGLVLGTEWQDGASAQDLF